jgi:hypothetical protein
MRDEGPFPSYPLVDDGRAYRQGQRVRIERTPQVDIVSDVGGNYKVESCKRDRGVNTPGLIRVDLRRVG